MWYVCRFLFWLGEQNWFPFSTLRLWYWALGKVGEARVMGMDKEYEEYHPDDLYDPQICHQHGWLNCEICEPSR